MMNTPDERLCQECGDELNDDDNYDLCVWCLMEEDEQNEIDFEDEDA